MAVCFVSVGFTLSRRLTKCMTIIKHGGGGGRWVLVDRGWPMESLLSRKQGFCLTRVGVTRCTRCTGVDRSWRGLVLVSYQAQPLVTSSLLTLSGRAPIFLPYISCFGLRLMTQLLLPNTAGKNGVIAPDQTTFDYVKARTDEEFEPMYSDANAKFSADYTFDVSKLEPLVRHIQNLYEESTHEPVAVLTFLAPEII